MASVKININVNDKVLDKVDKLVLDQGRSRSDFIREAINKLLKDYKVD